MHYLVLQVVCSVTFMLLLRYGQMRLRPMYFVFACNYVAAAVFSAIKLVNGPHADMDALLLVLGLINGVLYLSHLPALMYSFHRAGIGITVAISTSGCIVPVLMAWMLWPESEAMTAGKWMAVAILPVALFLLRPAHGEKLRLDLRGELALFMPFAIAGAIGCIHKVANHHAQPEQNALYQMVLFISASMASWGYVVYRRENGNARDVGLGLVIGLVNTFGTLLLLLALTVLPASVYFPVNATGIIVGNLVAARLVWGERIARRQAAGIGVAVAIVWLIAHG